MPWASFGVGDNLPLSSRGVVDEAHKLFGQVFSTSLSFGYCMGCGHEEPVNRIIQTLFHCELWTVESVV
jgi:hypothetical protein